MFHAGFGSQLLALALFYGVSKLHKIRLSTRTNLTVFGNRITLNFNPIVHLLVLKWLGVMIEFNWANIGPSM